MTSPPGRSTAALVESESFRGFMFGELLQSSSSSCVEKSLQRVAASIAAAAGRSSPATGEEEEEEKLKLKLKEKKEEAWPAHSTPAAQT